MSIIDDCVQFLEDLILGDFNEEQMVSAQVIGGLISLIPVVDQVMDVRDISGCLYNINKHGGMSKATLDQKITLGFAAFGVIPEVGSAFKTVFKPLYKERKALKGAFNGGVAMVERMLGVKKGGAVKWVRALDWAGNTQAAIIKANFALESSIQMLEYIAAGHWWCPDHLEQLARDVIPSIKSLRGKLAAPIREAAAEIKKFLEELLGEHAAAVALALAQNAATTPRGGHGGPTRNNAVTPRAARDRRHEVVAEKPRTQGKVSASKAVTVTQRLAYEGYKALNFAAKGLMGEHIVDHYVIEKMNWGLDWNVHDTIDVGSSRKAGWQNDFRKINDNQTPLYLCTPSKHVLQAGIDSVWFTNRAKSQQYAIVEAKANMNPAADLLSMLGEAKSLSASSAVNTPPPAKGGKKAQTEMVLQMSKKWVDDRIRKDFFRLETKMYRNYSRHVFLVTPIQAAEHTEVMTKILSEGLVDNPRAAQRYAEQHAEHNIQRAFTAQDIDAAEARYIKSGKPKRSTKPRKPKK
ncbi:hypothetical protein GTP41_20560 [Pseudoduganella sp. DS3]|uniref:Uncharacterized protein n=1 Tax=Pseudoduganella guangdongensis TaxID=2692179 RepID=A0A6N9HLG2_9BURK|nr:hypothetical protein [Pseudoduganella guangdongensis]MYN04488.1 hypothetical protein [Pseudoduganella guangdongensis]